MKYEDILIPLVFALLGVLLLWLMTYFLLPEPSPEVIAAFRNVSTEGVYLI